MRHAAHYCGVPHPGERETEAHDHLAAYTLALGDPEFIHQHVVDAWAVQHATSESKAIGVYFGLAGLYLHLERGFTGREVQLAHIKLARTKRVWPTFALPEDRGAVTAIDVMMAPEGSDRAKAIDRWCASVWGAVDTHHAEVRRTVSEHLAGS